MSSPRRTAGDDCVREELRQVNLLALMFITVVLVVMFVYDQWNTWRRETAWRRAASTATIRLTDSIVHEEPGCMTVTTGAHATTHTQGGPISQR
jgi:hypothetical protein